MDARGERGPLSRRSFLLQAVVGVGGLAGIGLAACSSGATAVAQPTASTSGPAVTASGTTSHPATGGSGTAAASAQQQLTVADAQFSTGTNSGDLAEIDPARRGTWGFGSLLWAPLVAQDAQANLVKEKSLAPTWDVSVDGKVYTFHLRPESKFSDGSPLTAHDVVDNIGYIAMMDTKEAIGYRDNFGTYAVRLLYDVVGLLDAAQKGAYDPYGTLPVPGVKAMDDHTLQISLLAPSATFITRLMPAIGVFRKADLTAAKSLQLGQLDFWPAHAVNSGPYKLSKAVPGDHFELVPNAQYFGPKPTIGTITVRALGNDPNTLLTAFGSKQIDLVSVALEGAAVRQALANPSLASTLVEVPNWLVDQYWITPNPPLDDEHARRAVTMAIDFHALANILNAGSARPLFTPVKMHLNPGVPACQSSMGSVTALPFDPVKAKQELAQSAYGVSAADMEINMLSTAPTDLVGLQAVQKMLQDNLGMTNIKIHTEKVANLLQPPFPLHLWPNSQQPWFPDIPEVLSGPISHMLTKPWTASQPRPNIAVAYVPTLSALLDQARNENDPVKRCALSAQAEQLWNDSAFSLNYGVPNTYFMIHPWVQGTKFYVNGVQGMPENIEAWTVAAH